VNPVLVNLDKVVIFPDWGQHYPLCRVSCLLRIGFDHAPIVLDTGEGNVVKGSHFHFEKKWFLIPYFKEDIFRNMAETFLSQKDKCALDVWQWVMAQLTKFLRGYGDNIRGE
jgi:hypothetical protein